MKKLLLLLLVPTFVHAQTVEEIHRWEAQAQRVNIIEDNWGIPHIYGKTDADAVFGLLYVQCRQNFPQVERNYLEMMGRLSEVERQRTVYNDLQMRLLYDSAGAKADYRKAPDWLKKLLDAFADGVNYYLYKHPEVKPKVLARFEPWFPLMYTDGSIAPTQTGGMNLRDLRNLYEEEKAVSYQPNDYLLQQLNPSGSNGFALAPSKTASGNAMLYINPHVTFYFRTEVHMASEEGLDAYGAVTWGQFFIYQGFNEYCGWMHTSSYADVADVYREKISHRGDSLLYFYEGKYLPVKKKEVAVSYKDGNSNASKSFTTYATHHGPVLGSRSGEWMTVKENNRSMESLMQSWLRTKAKGLPEFKKVMDMKINNSNNTVFADKFGNIAYWHGNFMPRRDTKYNWSLPVDGTTAATEWKGLHPVSETVHLVNPTSGWIQNCNSTPFTSAGASSPKKENYPAYMAPDGQNGRALNAMRLLSPAKNLTLDDLIHLGYNTYLSAFDFLLPSLFAAYDALTQNDSVHQQLATPIHYLKTWNKEAAASSVATTLAVEWAYLLAAKVPPARTTEEATNAVGQFEKMAKVNGSVQLQLLKNVMSQLQRDHGTWQLAWGDLNRYQRPADGKFDDSKPSLPVALGPGAWGSIPSFFARYADTKKRYGVSGNSFIAAVEFGKKLKAKTIMTGGESFDPSSPNFTDQAAGFIEGSFKEINFYKEDVQKHRQRQYRPGEE
ncbi:MAG: penicillin acylase family protein [Flavisolibacter sp.]